MSTGRTSDLATGTSTRALLNTLVQREPGGPAFQEAAFGEPVIGADGCTTQQRFVLKSGAPWSMATPCMALSGEWPLLWEIGLFSEDPSVLDVAYTVPLEEAWYAGAWAWTPEERKAFANDTFTDLSMQVMTIEGKKGRGSSDPAHWWPPTAGYRCGYAAEWVAVKARWNLTVDPAEYDAIMTLLNQTGSDTCGNPFDLIPPHGLYPGVGPAAVLGKIGAPPGIPYNLVSVQAYDSNQSVLREIQVRMDGTFELAGLPPGDYTLKFLGGTSGTADQWYSTLGPGGPATVLTLSAGRIADVVHVGMIVPPSFTRTASFHPNETVNPDAMAALLYRYAGTLVNPTIAATAFSTP